MTGFLLGALVVVLSLGGLANAFYFTFAYYGRIKKARWVPEILCAREGSNCVTVVQTPYASVFGLPNSLFGIFYYLILVGWIAAGHPRHFHFSGFQGFLGSFPLGTLLIVVAALTVLLGFYLIYSLLYKLHTHCPLCYTAHGINAALLVLLIALA